MSTLRTARSASTSAARMAEEAAEEAPAAADPPAAEETTEGEENLHDEVREHARYVNYQYFLGAVTAPNATFGTAFDGDAGRLGTATGPMRPADVSQILGHYVAPQPAFRKAQRILDSSSLVVLCG